MWHFSKKIKQALRSKGKLKRNENLVGWITSINRFWWSSATFQENHVIIGEKWLSVLQHVANKHEWEGDQNFHSCEHGPLGHFFIFSSSGLAEGSPAHNALKDIVNDETILKDLPYLTKFCHSGELEVFHSLCLTRIGFCYHGKCARTRLAVMMDHNSGLNRKQSRTKDGEAKI